ncbi:ROK family protein [Corallococcus exiguus]|uniref:ROK family protein n=1 Tax=Corallococcus TaxID=83461 RepID=UPI000EE8F4A2|nr:MULTISPECIES: ROK family protein [Corallococcus]NNB89602.1 ROK family protein [Corallococcus exiguus]NNB97115.1 ROK family protein [Corallococcus exiguus]NNC06219.1 ROK family protein [Corallococcus exiguus]NPC48853.1 ROK family protein [Corallococcus exiguus]RKH79834.1 ROK family protein [Corallococcus sp. AB032C]
MPTLGIDLGGTFARAAVVDGKGEILASAKVAVQDRKPQGVVETIAQAAEEAVKQSGVKVDGCGVGAAGQIHKDTGVISVAPNLGWRDVPLAAMLTKRLGFDVKVVNDLSAAAWGELHAGAGRGAQDILVVFVGSGVGSAIIADGRLVQGGGGVAGELGHIKVVPGGRLCGCGEHGCLEAYAGGHNLIAQTKELLASGGSRVLETLAHDDPDTITPVTLETAAEAGDAKAKEIHDRAARFLALAVANYVTVLNPSRLVLGGGVLTHCPGIKRQVLDGVQQWSSRVSREGLLIADAELGDDSGIIGAALLVK